MDATEKSIAHTMFLNRLRRSHPARGAAAAVTAPGNGGQCPTAATAFMAFPATWVL
jgi:hypothetical protein